MRKFLLPLLCISALSLFGCADKSDQKAAALKTISIEPQTVEALLEKRLTQNFVPGEVIIKMKTTAGVASAMSGATMKSLGLEEKGKTTSGGEVIYKIPTDRLTTMSAKAVRDNTLQAVKSLQARADVEYAQPNYIFQVTAAPDDPGFTNQWHYFNNGSGAGEAPGGINLPKAWDSNKGSSAVVVAVIDTGILPNHEDVSGSPNLLAGYDMITDPAIGNDSNGRDADASDPGDAIAANECFPGSPAQPNSWHGTHVAGTIGVGKTNNTLGVSGVNWNVKVLPVRVLGKCGGTMVDINDAIRWAAGLPVPGVPANTNPAKVINMSLGAGAPCSASPATQSAINDAVAAGATIVVAAGNEASDASGFLPASCTKVITVAASDRLGRLATRYSNFGTRVDILAPGGDVRQDSDNNGNPDGVLSLVQGGYAYYNGTSMAAPHVAGVAAMLLAQDPTRTPAQILSILKTSAISRTSSQCPKPCGAGLLNAAVAGTSTPPPAGGLVLSVSPNNLSLKAGKTGSISVSLTRAGTPEAGGSIRFMSNDPSVATVNPASALTDAAGQTSAIIEGKAQGSTVVRVATQGQVRDVPVTVKPAKASALSSGMLILLALGWWVVRRRRDASV